MTLENWGLGKDFDCSICEIEHRLERLPLKREPVAAPIDTYRASLLALWNLHVGNYVRVGAFLIAGIHSSCGVTVGRAVCYS